MKTGVNDKLSKGYNSKVAAGFTNDDSARDREIQFPP